MKHVTYMRSYTYKGCLNWDEWSNSHIPQLLFRILCN